MTVSTSDVRPAQDAPRTPPAASPAPPRISIQTASSWVLRIGVVVSLAVMGVGLGRAFAAGGVTVHEMENRSFSSNYGQLIHGLAGLQPFALMELGVVLLVLTPILRVFTAMVLFIVEERDGMYALVTFLVLVMTLTSLLFIK
jgi:uncharacterized membrane protein